MAVVEACKRFEFAAHHKLPYHKGKCARDHGHNYVVTVCLAGKIRSDDNERWQQEGNAGMVVDFSVLKELWKQIEDYELDHYSLNDFLANPTAENLTTYLVETITGQLEYENEGYEEDEEGYLFLSRLRVEETGDSYVEWRRHGV